MEWSLAVLLAEGGVRGFLKPASHTSRPLPEAGLRVPCGFPTVALLVTHSQRPRVSLVSNASCAGFRGYRQVSRQGLSCRV